MKINTKVLFMAKSEDLLTYKYNYIYLGLYSVFFDFFEPKLS